MLRNFVLALAASLTAGFAPQIAKAQTIEDGQGAIELNDSGSTNHPVRQPKRQSGGIFQPKVGRSAAAKYMGQTGNPDRNPSADGAAATVSSAGSGTSSDHYLAIHLGTFVSDNAYKWGSKDRTDNVGKYTFGVTYRVGEWVKSMDLAIRVDLNGYNVAEGRTSKLSFLPIIMFPEANSRFPLYFGAGLGAGVFINQVAEESSLSLDYQVLAGLRFFDVFENTGFFLEAGLKNHLFLLSDGQFNGTYVAIGSVFTF